jgi:WhiB family transcriptional regulator, redox-sensing transcriptional regulator
VNATVTDLSTRLGWTARAACRNLADFDSVFFGFDGEHDDTRNARETEAKAVCAGCPVRLRCALWALRTGTPYGVFGGLGEQERAAMKRAGNWKEAAA